MGGEPLYEELTKINPQVRALLVSGHSLHEKVPALRDAGLNGFVQKPFDLSKLGRAVRRCLDGDEGTEDGTH